MLNPSDAAILTALAGVYLRLGAVRLARRTLEEARAIRPRDVNVLTTLGEIYREEREYELAAEVFRQVLEIDNAFLEAASGLGQCAVHLGETSIAVEAFERRVAAGHKTVSTLYALSEFPAEMVNVDVLSLLDEAESDYGQSRENFEILKGFALAGALDKRGRAKEAWDALVSCNNRMSGLIGEYPQHERAFQAQILADTIRRPVETNRPARPAAGDVMTLFILGPSRAGKTTLEKLIARSPEVKRGFENPSVENSVRQAFLEAALPPREQIIQMPPPLDDIFRSIYDKELATRTDGERVFTNTHPGLIHSVMRLASVLPNVRFVFVKRDIEDIVLRIYMKKYMESNLHAYNIENIRSYIIWYYDMIDALAARLPHISQVVSYEDIVADPGGITDRMLGLCGLSAVPGCTPEVGDDRGCALPYRLVMTA